MQRSWLERGGYIYFGGDMISIEGVGRNRNDSFEKFGDSPHFVFYFLLLS